MNAFKKILVVTAAAATLGALGLATQASATEVSENGYQSYVGWGPSYGYGYHSYGYNSYPSYGYSSYGGYGHHSYGYGYGHSYGYGYGHSYGYGY